MLQVLSDQPAIAQVTVLVERGLQLPAGWALAGMADFVQGQRQQLFKRPFHGGGLRGGAGPGWGRAGRGGGAPPRHCSKYCLLLFRLYARTPSMSAKPLSR